VCAGFDIVDGQGIGAKGLRVGWRQGASRLAWLVGTFAVAGVIIATQPALPQAGATAAKNAEDFVKVRYEAGTSLRSLAQKYLNDPDLWPIILRLNSIDDISDLQEGQEFLLPANQVKLSASALDASLVEIQKANEAGAQLFAPVLIKNAIDYRDRAVVENNNGIYAESISLSSKSIASAGEARTTSEQRRDVEAEARLSDRQGWVEGQKIQENSWSDRELNSVLNEQEKLRTLSDSTAQVVFRDASRLRLNPNSQAVIQRMRDDPLSRRKEAQISLVEGDFYALLAPESERSKLEVSLKNVDAKIDSGNFWVSQDKDTAKFSNYDNAPVAIVSGGETMTLGRNEGAVVRSGEAPEEKVDVFGRPTLTAPQDNSIIYGSTARLAWEEMPGQHGYWVEIAFDPRFDSMVDSKWGIAENHTDDLALAPGAYYWRVAALDSLGLPGQMSTVRKFELINDSAPPFLRIRTPGPAAVLREAAVSVSGETEAGSAVFVQGEVASVDQNGRFFFTLQATEGQNDVAVVARDPAGNETKRQLQFIYLKDEKRAILYDSTVLRDGGGRFLTSGRQLSLAGVVAEGAKVTIVDSLGGARSETYADQSGHFAINVPLTADAETLKVSVTTVSGYAYEEPIEAIVSDQPPKFKLRKPLRPITSQAELEIDIDVQNAATLTVSGEPAEMRDGVAHARLTLKPGPNLVEVVATNAVGLVTIEKHTVVFDDQKPEMTDKEVVAKRLGETEMLSIRIGASDASGLALTSRFRVATPGGERSGVLRFNKANSSYQGSIEVPVRPDGSPLDIVVELTDMAGNVSEVRLQ
jgi:hypothetical protein